VDGRFPLLARPGYARFRAADTIPIFGTYMTMPALQGAGPDPLTGLHARLTTEPA
jgi:hypothetical protein